MNPDVFSDPSIANIRTKFPLVQKNKMTIANIFQAQQEGMYLIC